VGKLGPLQKTESFVATKDEVGEFPNALFAESEMPGITLDAAIFVPPPRFFQSAELLIA
jgi:hypothetical protein